MSSRKMLSWIFGALVLLIAVVAFQNLNRPKASPPAKPIGAVVAIRGPLGLPPVPVEADNPPTAETIALGRRLYYDPGLSSDGSISCASCHRPDAGFADPNPVSKGVQQKTGTSNSPP